VASIDPRAAIGAVHLTVSDLGRSVRFYESHLGFVEHARDGRTARLGAGGPDLLVLTECETAPRVRGTTGLYHFAVLVPNRVELARSLRRLVETETVLQGFADHGVSEAIYLADPDGNGIEIYRDRPRGEWPYLAGRLHMGADPLDVEELLRSVDRQDRSGAGLAKDTVVGHVHLHVARLDEAEAFYVGVLGFDVMQRYGPAALFVSAGGYHHHIGLNTWAGVGAPPPPPGAIGLRHFVVRLPDRAALDRTRDRIRAAGLDAEDEAAGVVVRDPARNAVMFVSEERA